MKFLVSLILIALVAWASFLFAVETPWWIFAIGALIAGWAVPLSPFKSLLSGFLAVFCVWLVLCYMADNANAGLMSSKIASILPLNGSSIALMIVSGVVGGLVGGMAALTGAFLRKKPAK